MIPLKYNARNLVVRWKTTLMTASGFTLVVAALVVMLAFVAGVEQVCTTSGELENVIVLAKGNNDEVFSQMDTRLAKELENFPGVARGSIGQPLASREMFLVVHRLLEQEGVFKFLQIRGVMPVAFEVHTGIDLIEGRPLRASQSEVIIGKGVQREHQLNVGDQVDIGRKKWTVAGVFTAGGSAFESEVWCDLTEVASQFRREGVYSSVVLRTESSESAFDLTERLKASRSIVCNPKTEPEYYAKQAEQMQMLSSATWTIAWFMGIGAIFGVMNTMFAAIGQRRKDIAVLRIMGFQAHEILISFLLEAILISIIGGGLGIALGAGINGFSRSTAVGGVREIEFAFRVTEGTVIFAAAFSLGMGVLGGLLPALSVVRIQPLEALR
ncbi:MAG: ABC transporter permease [Planctomycetaceae bacterium]|nr:ABC transporter permease [Planctomycetaceae bacterium]